MSKSVVPRTRKKSLSPLARSVGEGLRKSAAEARRMARMHGTRIWIVENGKLVGKKP
jgi:ribosome biogenesis protein Nip4